MHKSCTDYAHYSFEQLYSDQLKSHASGLGWPAAPAVVFKSHCASCREHLQMKVHGCKHNYRTVMVQWARAAAARPVLSVNSGRRRQEHQRNQRNKLLYLRIHPALYITLVCYTERINQHTWRCNSVTNNPFLHANDK